MALLCDIGGLQASSTDIRDFSVLCTIHDTAQIVSKPTAIWNQEKHKLLWKVPHLEVKNVSSDGVANVKFLAQWDVPSRTDTFHPVLAKYVQHGDRFTTFEVDINSVELHKTSCKSILAISLQMEPAVLQVNP
jgi:hypothetical protein